jgi:hypothetical protein
MEELQEVEMLKQESNLTIYKTMCWLGKCGYQYDGQYVNIEIYQRKAKRWRRYFLG